MTVALASDPSVPCPYGAVGPCGADVGEDATWLICRVRFGEGARETATTSKEGAARKLPNRHGEVVTINNNTGLIESGNWNEYNLNPLTRIHWRASTVPAAAVIPAQ
ncbi:hypothetical protein RND71_019104 [Anisodus tanguticus]|uniref:Uncharacterized protein n=1 Tax=Anisodus tanguticus TaxID=243964 RepID=A0AAE1RZX9_9SOLA|nr:hypothetical protein RND71_019104 [Anisodus tanguticus]